MTTAVMPVEAKPETRSVNPYALMSLAEHLREQREERAQADDAAPVLTRDAWIKRTIKEVGGNVMFAVRYLRDQNDPIAKAAADEIDRLSRMEYDATLVDDSSQAVGFDWRGDLIIAVDPGMLDR